MGTLQRINREGQLWIETVKKKKVEEEGREEDWLNEEEEEEVVWFLCLMAYQPLYVI